MSLMLQHVWTKTNVKRFDERAYLCRSEFLLRESDIYIFLLYFELESMKI